MITKLWAANETKRMTLKDKRLQDRAAMLLEIIAENPKASIPQAHKGSKAGTKAAYRLIGTTKITEQDILNGHYDATVSRIKKSKVKTLIFASDGMDAGFNTLRKTKGLGPITSPSTSLGIKMHNTIAFSEEGEPFGLIDQEYWIRNKDEYGKRHKRSKKPTKDKESNYWLNAVENIEERLPLEKDYVFIGDGGADIFDLFRVERRPNSHLLFHQAQNRNVEGGKLYDLLDQKKSVYIIKTLKRTPTSPERTVKLEVRFGSFDIKSPDKTKAADRTTINMHCLIAKEVWSDHPTSNPIIWRLITTIPINSAEDAERVIKLYAQRWLVERYHYILKEGIGIEKLQMETSDNLKRAIALYSIVACRIMYIAYIGRINPEAPATLILSKDEWQALYCYHHETTTPSKEPPTVKQAILMMAKIGGFLGRTSDGEPGAKVLWRGLSALEFITRTYRIFHNKNVGKG